MKPFRVADFVSNEKTPVVDQHKNPVHIISTHGRGIYSVVGYPGGSDSVAIWKPDRLFFAPVKQAVEVDIYRNKFGTLSAEIKTPAPFPTTTSWTYIGTIKGEVEF